MMLGLGHRSTARTKVDTGPGRGQGHDGRDQRPMKSPSSSTMTDDDDDDDDDHDDDDDDVEERKGCVAMAGHPG